MCSTETINIKSFKWGNYMKKILVLTIITLGFMQGLCNAAKLEMKKVYKLDPKIQDAWQYLKTLDYPKKKYVVVLNLTQDSFDILNGDAPSVGKWKRLISLGSYEYAVLPFSKTICVQQGGYWCSASENGRILFVMRSYSAPTGEYPMGKPTATWIETKE